MSVAVTAGDAIVKTDRLSKHYGETVAVDRLDLRIRRGEVFGLLGPNGAGKTTTILMLLGLTEPTSGAAEVDGLSPARDALLVKARVGYLPDDVGFYDDLTARDNLRFTAALNRIRRRDAEERVDTLLTKSGWPTSPTTGSGASPAACASGSGSPTRSSSSRRS